MTSFHFSKIVEWLYLTAVSKDMVSLEYSVFDNVSVIMCKYFMMICG